MKKNQEKLIFNFKNTQLKEEEFKNYKTEYEEIIKKLQKASNEKFNCLEASINLIDDNNIIEESRIVNNKLKDAKIIVVIGIGGSNLGTIAIYEALKGKYYNQIQDKKVYFADTTDSNKIRSIILLLEKHIKKKEKIVLNVISKSGGTTETIANFEIFLEFLKNNQLNYQKYIVATTEKDSKLYDLSKKNNFNILTLEKNIGGRYSVFSNVGIFPLMFLEINVEKLIQGAKEIKEICLNKNYKKNPALNNALILLLNSKKGINIVNSFFFSEQLESIGKWYRQLMGESIGKEFNLNKKKINFGLTPTTSIGSTDLHSMGQLFLGGPNDKYHQIIKINKVKKEKLPKLKEFENIVSNIQGITLDKILNAIISGIENSFKERKISFSSILFEELTEFEIGGFLQMKMFEIIYLGYLLNINPFDQPNVEEYKIITKKYF